MGKLPSYFGDFIKKARQNLPLSSDEIEVAVLGKTVIKGRKRVRRTTGSAVRMWEGAHSLPHLKHLPKIAKVLGLALPELWRAYRYTILEEQGFEIAEFEPTISALVSKPPTLVRINWGSGEVKIVEPAR